MVANMGAKVTMEYRVAQPTSEVFRYINLYFHNVRIQSNYGVITRKRRVWHERIKEPEGIYPN